MLLNLNRPNIRGIKKCRFCGYYNGNRSKSCKNQNCIQFLECGRGKNKYSSPVDPITIHSADEVQYFSVLVADGSTPRKLNSAERRNFVKIEESTIKTNFNSVLMCRTAVCYLDSCLKSQTQMANCCTHISECLKVARKPVSSAVEVPIKETNFLKFFSHLGEAERNELWDYYAVGLRNGVQRLKENWFVVKVMPSGNKENSGGGLNGNSGSSEYVHCKLGQKTAATTVECSCGGGRGSGGELKRPCQHLLLLCSAIDGCPILRDKFKLHLDSVCKELDLYALDLFELENSLALAWDTNANELIDHMISDDQLLEQSLEFELMDDLQITDLTDLSEILFEPQSPIKSNTEEMQQHQQPENQQWDEYEASEKKSQNKDVSFDTILTSIVERINCNFNACGSSGEKDTSLQEFVFYVHNVRPPATNHVSSFACQSN